MNEIFLSLMLGLCIVGLITLYVYVEFLRGRLDKQTELIGILSQALRRLENEVHGRQQ